MYRNDGRVLRQKIQGWIFAIPTDIYIWYEKFKFILKRQCGSK